MSDKSYEKKVLEDSEKETSRDELEQEVRKDVAAYLIKGTGRYSEEIQKQQDEEFEKHNLRGLYLGNFIPWDPVKQTEFIKKKYKWVESKDGFERTYKKASNLDDMHENGIHDYLKWIKFGYGRCSDHASKDIRMGYFNRSKGIEYVKKYDHVKPKKDLKRWLEYVNISEDEFDRIADKFRDERVWSVIDNKWHKMDIDGEFRSYGYCNLNNEEKKKYEKNKN